MGYRVEYAPVKKVRGLEKRTSRVSALTAVCLLLFFLMVGSLWPKGAETLQKLIFPGDPVVTAAALEDLTENLRAGTELSDCMTAFCVQVLEGAKLDTGR